MGSKRSKLTSAVLRRVEPGATVWDAGVGYRRYKTRPGGGWYIRYRIPLLPDRPTPTRPFEERIPHCDNATQARRILEERRAAVFKGTYQPETKRQVETIRDFVPTFLRLKRTLRSVGKYRQQLEGHIVPFFGNAPLREITSQLCTEYYNTRLDSGAKVATANNELRCLSSLFSSAIESGRCSRNPVSSVKLFPVNNVRDRLLTAAENRRLFDAADREDDFIRPLFYVLYFTGMRISEALALEWTDYQPEHSRLHVRDSKNRTGRHVPLNTELQRILGKWRHFTGTSRWVFPTTRVNAADEHLTRSGVRKAWTRVVSRAGVTNFSPHDLRRNLVSMLEHQGYGFSTIAGITGHKSRGAFDRYAHSDTAMRQEAVDALRRPERKAGRIVPIRA